MAEAGSNLPLKREAEGYMPPARPGEFFGSLREEIERVFEDFDRGLWRYPFGRRMALEPFGRRREPMAVTPSVDIVEKEDSFELTADLPGMEEKNIELKLSGDILTIKGEREEEKEEKKQDFYLCERHFGSFERSFQVPESIDPEKIDAHFKNGVLSVILPKKPEARKPEKTIKIT